VGAAARHAYLHSRVSVLKERLLPEESLDSLVKSTPEQTKEVLARTELAYLTDEDLADMSRLEQRLILALLADFMILVRPLVGPGRDLLLHWGRRLELSNLKAIIRGKMLGHPTADIRSELLDIGPLTSLPLDDLLRTEDVAEMLRLLEKTPYGDIATQARHVFTEERQLFSLEAAIDRRYYSGLAKRASVGGSSEQRSLQPLLGALMDQVNLVWLLRYRFAYHFPPAEAYYLLVPYGRHLGSQRLRELARLEGLEELISQLPEPLAEVLAGASSTTDVERRLEAETVRETEIILYQSVFELARALAYLMLREQQLIRIYGILKGRHLRLDSELIRLTARLTVKSEGGTYAAP
jgi:V/A-type H+-transporting ATPase subunit C